MPVCTAISCGEAPLSTHSNIEYSNKYGAFTFMTKAKYTCDEGYYLEGTQVLTCLPNGKYGNIDTGYFLFLQKGYIFVLTHFSKV